MTRIVSSLTAAIAGALFAAGLSLGGMTQPARVQGFLDVGGAWDPTLAFVMLGAVSTYAVLHRLVMRRAAPLFDASFYVPAKARVDARLLSGAAIFGVGWGLAGYCPGPALTSVGVGSLEPIAFVAAMLAGMLLERHLVSPPQSTPAPDGTNVLRVTQPR